MSNPEFKNEYIFSSQKRIFDILAGLALLGFSHPIEKVVVGRLECHLDIGPHYVHQKRAGGTVIKKIRTMIGADNSDNPNPLIDSGPLDSPRIPPGFAIFVRKCRLDELPQIEQVVSTSIENRPNRLSLVGIRPLLERHADEYYSSVKHIDSELADRWRGVWVETAPKGITGPASVRFANRRDNAEIDRYEYVKMDDEYCRNASIEGDVKIMGQTGLLLARMGLAID